MERPRVTRGYLQSQITRTVNDIGSELAKDELDLEELEDKSLKLEELVPKLNELNGLIWNAMLDGDTSDDERNKEFQEVEDYADKIRKIRTKVKKVLKPVEPANTTQGQAQDAAAAVPVQDQMQSFKLPKFDIKKFDGETRNWLSFWSQFKRVDENPKFQTVDKFQYLIQSTEDGSKARKLVESYPMTDENYPKVKKQLQEKYGDDTMLMEFYVKEMVNMILIPDKCATLEDIVTRFVSHLRSLESLGLKQGNESVYLYSMFESLLPVEVIDNWQRCPSSGYDRKTKVKPEDRLDALIQFAEDEIRREQRLALVKDHQEPSKCTVKSATKSKKVAFKGVSNVEEDDIPTVSALHIGQSNICIFCDRTHLSQNCSKPLEMSLEEKKAVITRRNACFCCLRLGHRASACKSFVKCSGCLKRHFHIMCPDAGSNKKVREDPVVETKSVNTNRTDLGRLVLLHTIKVKSVTGGKKILRMMLDDGSQRSYIRASVAKMIKCNSVRTFMERNVSFGGVATKPEKRMEYLVPLQNLSESRKCELILADVEKITGRIPSVPQGPWIEELRQRNIQLTDLHGCDDEIDILIGMDHMRKIITGSTMLLSGGLIARETIFGWTVGGEIPGIEEESIAMTITSALLNETSCSQLWELEAIGIQDPAEVISKKEREEEVKQHFLENVSRNEDGRYCVSLPWVGDVQQIPTNKSVAEKRLLSSTLKLKKDEKTEAYGKIFEAWSEEGFVEEVVEREESACHYLPHRAVYKPESRTTPVRPVFDASCKVGRNPSLNECLEKGPNFIELIPTIMHRFRERKYGVISDIRKAFQMIEVADRDKDYLRFLWWEDPACKNIKVMRHNRVVFGVNCSPFLLGAVLDYHLSGVKEEDKLIANKLMKSMYVDNCVTSVESEQEYLMFKEASTRILAEAKMDLREWECGPVEVSGVGHFSSEGCGLEAGSAHTSFDTLVLGMKWNKFDDTLRCDTVPAVPEVFTKRSLLSIMQKIFDPMGFLSPAMIFPKLALQEAWSQKIGWDEDLPEGATVRIKKWALELNHLEEVRIPRSMEKVSVGRSKVQIHVFCDASQHAYAAGVFLRVDQDTRVTVKLLQSKARVAPLKKSTIPRLELLGCTIAARLWDSVKKDLEYEGPVYFWSDSSTALAWVKRNDEWGTFVGNRVREICRLSDPKDWRHVPGIHNPADLPSRGCTPKELLTSRWWEGPEWLRKPEQDWPTEDINVDEDTVLAEKKKHVLKTVMTTSAEGGRDPWYVKRSSFSTCVRVLAYVKRFVIRTRKQHYYNSKELTSEEFEVAERHLFRLIQEESFSTGGNVVCGLNVKMRDNVMCVVTRLTNREDTPGFRYPVLLPHHHVLVDRLIFEEHLKNGHAGVQFLMARLREKCWIMKTRKAIRTVVQRCVICRRYSAKAPQVPVSPLPEDRVKNAKVFEVTGVDLAGPLYLKDKSKVWIVLFTCAVYRAIHLELVTSLSADAFLLALVRFIKRRGRPSIIYSDNGTNFVGADNLFKSLDWEKIVAETKIDRIEWKFNPPSAAWWGGWWERLVRTVKDLLKRMLGHGKLGYVHLETCLCEVEAVVNSRPLTYVSEDQVDLIPLSPVMFMQDVRETGCPEVEVLNGGDLRQRYKDLSTLKEELRHRFRSEYLGQLVHKGKANLVRKFEVGEVVLVASDNKKRLQWPMARILELISGRDGNIRIARVKTATGDIIRPLQRLIPLEVKSEAPGFNVTPEVKIKAKELKKTELEKVVKVVPAEPEVLTRAGRKINKPARFI